MYVVCQPRKAGNNGGCDVCGSKAKMGGSPNRGPVANEARTGCESLGSLPPDARTFYLYKRCKACFDSHALQGEGLGG